MTRFYSILSIAASLALVCPFLIGATQMLIQ